jgi:putative addiction module killer protein
MESQERYIEFYRDIHGRSHFHEWLLKLPIQVRARITDRIARVGRGAFGDIKPVGEGVSELRIHFGPGYRVYLAIGDKNLLVLAGSVKNDQERTIQFALNLWKEYKSRLT